MFFLTQFLSCARHISTSTTHVAIGCLILQHRNTDCSSHGRRFYLESDVSDDRSDELSWGSRCPYPRDTQGTREGQADKAHARQTHDTYSCASHTSLHWGLRMQELSEVNLGCPERTRSGCQQDGSAGSKPLAGWKLLCRPGLGSYLPSPGQNFQ